MIKDIREAFGTMLVELASENRDIVALVGDSKFSSKLVEFAYLYPDRFFDLGIAEQNMMGVAAALAVCGKVVFTAAIANFIVMRAFEQIRTLICHPRLNVKIAGMQAGLAYPHLGASHASLEDLALMRVIPGIVVLYPADEWEARAVVRAAAEHKGPVYLRFGVQNTRSIFGPQYKFEIGRAYILKEGHDVALISAGPMLGVCLDTAEMLVNQGISVTVANLPTVKPIDLETIKHIATSVQRIVTVEEHTIIGGIGSAVSEAVALMNLPIRVHRIGVPDEFSVPGSREEVLSHFSLTAKHIYKTVRKVLASLDT